MDDNIGAVYILNGAAGLSEELEKNDISKYFSVYEVIRVIDRVPLYFEDHFARIVKSLRLSGMDISITEKEQNG